MSVDVAAGPFRRLEERFKPAGFLNNFEDFRTVSRVLLLISVGTALNILVVGLVAFGGGEPVVGLVSIATAVAYAVAAGVYVATGDALLLAHLMIWPSIANNIAVHVALGGFSWSGLVLSWGLLVTAAAIFVFPRRLVAVVAGIYLGAAVVLVWLEPTLRAGREQPPLVLTTFIGVDMFVVSLVVVIMLIGVLLSQISIEQERAQSLLLSILPSAVVSRLKRSRELIADSFEECTVLFADLVGFTVYAATVPAETLVGQLNRVFSSFDALVADAGAEKIKTIGDGYMAVAGVPLPDEDHAQKMCRLALQMRDQLDSLNLELGTSFQVRIGLNTGPVVAGVIGESKFSYDLWGDTVNLASRMESKGQPGRVQVTESVVEQTGDVLVFEELDPIELRGRMVTAFELKGYASE